MHKPKTSPKFYRNLIFVVGLIATLAYRIIIVLNNYSALWVEIAWHIGTLGFVWYFAHRYKVESKRARLITERKLVYKIYHKKKLDEADRATLLYALKSLKSSKAKWNYYAIFALSLIALTYSIIMIIIRTLG